MNSLTTQKSGEPTIPDCVVCLEQCDIQRTAIIDRSTVCHDCVQQIFERAIQSEEAYPPKWGRKNLSLKDYRHIVPREVRRLFREKETEYQTPPAERIYCTAVDPNLMLDVGETGPSCGTFVGRIAGDWAMRFDAGAITYVHCSSCSTSYCSICGEQCSLQHTCVNPGPTIDDTAFEGLERGKDYQICPSVTCHRKIELRDGCNSVTCRCGQRFCFVCGEGDIRTKHWRKTKQDGGCPRFGHPSAPNAIWDDGPDVDIQVHFERVNRVRLHAERRRNAIIGFLEAEEDDEDALRFAGDLQNRFDPGMEQLRRREHRLQGARRERALELLPGSDRQRVRNLLNFADGGERMDFQLDQQDALPRRFGNDPGQVTAGAQQHGFIPNRAQETPEHGQQLTREEIELPQRQFAHFPVFNAADQQVLRERGATLRRAQEQRTHNNQAPHAGIFDAMHTRSPPMQLHRPPRLFGLPQHRLPDAQVFHQQPQVTFNNDLYAAGASNTEQGQQRPGTVFQARTNSQFYQADNPFRQ